MYRVNFLLILLLLCSAALNSQASEYQLYSHFKIFGYSDPIALKAFSEDWNANFDGGNRALQHIWLDIGVLYNNWGIASIQRSHTELKFSKDTAEVFFLSKNKRSLEVGRRYNIQLNVNHISMSGMRLFHRFHPKKDFEFNFGFSLLKGKRLTAGQLTGVVSAQSNNDFNFNDLVIDYSFSKDSLFKKDVQRPTGYGYSFDAAFNWKASSNLLLEFMFENLYGQLSWKQAPFTVATVNSDNKETDEDGFVRVNPTLSGRHGNENIVQRLPILAHFNGTYNLTKHTNKYSTIVNIFSTRLKTFPSFGINYRNPTKQNIQILYDLGAKAIGLKFFNSWFSLSVKSDSFKINRSHIFSFQTSINIAL